jgi:hypothetical protein
MVDYTVVVSTICAAVWTVGPPDDRWGINRIGHNEDAQRSPIHKDVFAVEMLW